MEPNASQKSWPLAKLLGFRFVFLYFVIYSFPFPISFIPGVDDHLKPIEEFRNEAAVWFGKNIVGVTYEISTRTTGSGDMTVDYVWNLLIVVLAFLGMLLWYAIDRKGKIDPFLAKWFCVGVRYYLALYLISYGMVKVFKSQFSEPGFRRLIQPLGTVSPMGLLWTFMGFSPGYTIFAGAMETVAGLFLLWRRTLTFGALLTVAVMGNVVLMNFFYDVPVKLFSSNLLFMGIGLFLIDSKRMVNLFFLNRATEPLKREPYFNTTRANRIGWAVKGIYLSVCIIAISLEAHDMWQQYGQPREKPPFYGLYEVETFMANGELKPPLLTDKERWRYILIEWEEFMTTRSIDNTPQFFKFVPNEDQSGFQLGTGGPEEELETWSWHEWDDGVILLKGSFKDVEYEIQAKKVDLKNYHLVNRKFHWINEFPFNR